jgi:hypothetical protein
MVVMYNPGRFFQAAFLTRFSDAGARTCTGESDSRTHCTCRVAACDRAGKAENEGDAAALQVGATRSRGGLFRIVRPGRLLEHLRDR